MKCRYTLGDGAGRRRTAIWGIGIPVLFLVGMLGVAMHASGQPRQKTTEDAFFKVCSDCHDPDRIRETRRTRSGWEDVIYQMIDKGAVGTDADFNLVLQYLLSHYGMVNVNQASAEEIALVTGLSSKEGDAVVAYRKANGDFKNFDALVKVPGIDAQKLEAARAAILF
jgi:competence protein ComEA